jgi:SAM-dependent methyltransferase
LCPICNENNFNRVGKPKVTSKTAEMLTEDYTVVQCVSCGFCFVHPKIKFSQDDWQKLYDEEYFEPMTHWHRRNREKNRKERFDKLNRFANTTIKNFLDLGCGEGYALLEAESRGWQSNGIDISDNRVKEAKKKNIYFEQTDLISANFPSETFDCIYVDSVLEHILNPMEYLGELYRILSKGGIIYIGVPNENSLFNYILKIMYSLTGRQGESPKIKPFVAPFHVGGFTQQSLHIAIKQSGFSIKLFRNFASKGDILNYKFLSRGFMIEAFLIPFNFIAYILRKEIYFEVYLTK